MGIANFPFPSFTFVLTSDHVVIPGPSYVIRIAPLVVLPPHTAQTAVTVLTGNLANDDIAEENYPLANLNFENDSLPDVVSHHSDAEDEELTEMMSMSTYETRTVQTTGGNKLSLLKTCRFRFKSLFKRGQLNRLARPWVILVRMVQIQASDSRFS